ncbi:uncharacterized protein IUM83_00910 [Phytophthora cinnamomi]|uniref:uncharacterized protein n=1 Tax=Phytophthora cinnamomi TaxID=4785 RepID=UPI00355AAE70|nr:hypothetical protein IUM83_00910 [Phytophthora cinnamomi]
MCRMVENMEAEFGFEAMEKARNNVVGSYSLSAELWGVHYMKYVALLCHHVNEEFEPETIPKGPKGVIHVPCREDGGTKALAKQ